MSAYVIPTLFLLLLAYAMLKKVDTYQAFTCGAKSSIYLVLDIFSFIVAIFVIIELFSVSGLSDKLSNMLSPIFSFLGVPKELSKLVIFKPFSGSGGLALLSEIFETYGVDSYISRCACIILGSSETIFYVSAIFVSKTNTKKLGLAIPICLFCMIISVVIGCNLCKIL